MSMVIRLFHLIVSLFVIFLMVMTAEDETKHENWAVVPYNLTQNYLFPSFNEDTRRFRFKGIKDEIVIKQNWNGQGVSAVVWEAAIELTRYIIANKSMKGMRVLELGAGTGLVGIACSKLGAQVTVTDLREALPFLSKNIDLNFATNDTNYPIVQELKWGENLHLYHPNNYDVIIGADIVYIEDTFNDLLDTICYLCRCKAYESVLSRNNSTLGSLRPHIILSAKMRYSREAKFIAKMKKSFQVDHVMTVQDTNIHIYEGQPL